MLANSQSSESPLTARRRYRSNADANGTAYAKDEMRCNVTMPPTKPVVKICS